MGHKFMLMRNVPALPNKNTTYKKQLQKFFSKFKICPECKGAGSSNKKIKNIEGVANIPIEHIEELSYIKKSKVTPTTQVIRDILEYQCQKKVSCNMCHGFRFIKRDKASGKEQIQSRKQAKKKVDSKSKKVTR